VGKRWAGVIFVALMASSLRAADPFVTVLLQKNVTAVLDRDYQISLTVTPHPGDAWTRLAKRITGDADRWRELAERNGIRSDLTTEQRVRVPFRFLKPSLQIAAVRALFPQDQPLAEGWSHKVVASNGVEGEPYWKIAEWFIGEGGRYAEIQRSGVGLSSKKGDVVMIPRAALAPHFAAALPIKSSTSGAAESGQAEGILIQYSSAVTEMPTSKQKNLERAQNEKALAALAVGNVVESTHLDVAVSAVSNEPDGETSSQRALPPGQVIVEPSDPRSDPLVLEYGRSDGRAYAIYRLKKGEALYSSVAIRFTGRVYSNDVGDVIDALVKFNGIADVSRIPANHPVKVPLELLLPKYLPQTDPRRLLHETAERESSRAVTRVRARNLEGVHVILDAGHGGRDVGTIHEDLWESVYVYDVMCRLKKTLEKNSGAVVTVTTRSSSSGFRIPESGPLKKRTDHLVLTNPPYRMGDAAVGVNLRWYLANSVLRKFTKRGGAPEKVVFVSIHADSLHPSLRGAMMYVPTERYVRGSFSRSEDVYLTRSEVKESPTVSQTRKEALHAEGLSKELAESLLDSFGRSGLRVHPFNPVRENVFRGGREWVPAIIRYNKVPTRLLLEICNLANEEDRKLIKTAKYRQDVAGAIYEGLTGYFGERGDAPVDPSARTAAK